MPRHIVESAWLEHAPFAFWLMRAADPRQVVELGTHRGFSYMVFCQAVDGLELNARCFAVDTWEGDQHAGLAGSETYGIGIYEQLKAAHDPQYSGLSVLLRSNSMMPWSSFRTAQSISCILTAAISIKT
jgi:hypothetical protein